MSDVMNLGPCIEWTRGKDRHGYGRGYLDGQTTAAHRVAYCVHHRLSLADIAGVCVRHKCDNRACVNPDHLELGTQADNMKDMRERGRQTKGERNPNSKLTASDVAEIRFKHASGAALQSELANEYGVSFQQISKIVRGKAWIDVARTGGKA